MVTPHRSSAVLTALALALGAAISLGLARFSYALLLPPMRGDLGWSYFVAGAMNTVNAAGYLAGALLTPRWLDRHDPRRVLLAGCTATALLLAGHGLVVDTLALMALRLLCGLSSAAVFISGGLLAARLGTAATMDGSKSRAGLILGTYYGGTGLGIVASALVVPPLTALARPHAWQLAWFALAAAALLSTALLAHGTSHLTAPPAAGGPRSAARWAPMRWALASYFLFGLGYIGYMTFVVTLLRQQGFDAQHIVGFYALLGLGVMASSWIWARLLQHSRGGGAMALLNALLAVATLLPVVSRLPLAVYGSGALFGGVFLSVVASTTALVRHNLPAAAWPSGIAAFTIVFATGQIVGPSLVGWLADGPGGLERGFACSAAALMFGALLAWGQKPLPR